MTIQELNFVTFCIGLLARKKQISRNQVYSELKASGVLDDFIIPCYDVLHTYNSDKIAAEILTLLEKGKLND